jgi:hypothetical protein
MELLQLLFGSAEACGCVLDILAIFVNTGAFTSGRSYVRKRRAVKKEGGDPRQARSPLFWTLLVLGVLLTSFVVWKYARRLG